MAKPHTSHGSSLKSECENVKHVLEKHWRVNHWSISNKMLAGVWRKYAAIILFDCSLKKHTQIFK